MSNLFEKNYYDAPGFWKDGMLEDQETGERIKKTIELLPPDVRSILDAGCGNGIFLNTRLRERPDIKAFGFDRSEEALKYVLAPHAVGDVANIQFPDKSFDCVSCLEVVEHLPTSTFYKALSELTRVSRKYLLISVPYNENLEEEHNQCPSCKTIFNANLHLQTFGRDQFSNLFNQWNFTCKEISFAGAKEIYKYHYLYRRIFYREQFKRWRSPVCPVCGFGSQREDLTNENSVAVRNSLISFKTLFLSIPKLIWPKERRYYWIIGIFQKQFGV